MRTVPEFDLADRLKKARLHRHLEQREIASRVGISPSTARNYEHGETTPRWIELQRWAEVTDVDLEWLATGSTNHPGGASALRVLWKPRLGGLPRLDSNQQPAD